MCVFVEKQKGGGPAVHGTMTVRLYVCVCVCVCLCGEAVGGGALKPTVSKPGIMGGKT